MLITGRIIHALRRDSLEILNKGAIGVQAGSGIISFCKPAADVTEEEKAAFPQVVELTENQFLCPGFVDTHLHAPQYVNAGKGVGVPLLQWLEQYTFPAEAKHTDERHAADIYPRVVQRLLKNGTTTAAYFATVHNPATKTLVDIIDKMGQRALVGKVNMNQNSPDFYIETTERSLADTEDFIKYTLERNNPLVKPIITPRFAITCSSELMHGLAKLADKYDLMIQTHISENKDEISFTKELFPEASSYTDVYDRHGLLNSRMILAHCIHLTDDELQLIQQRGASVAHCPLSNFTLVSGVMDMRRMLDAGLRVGLGTDVSGGYSPSMLNAIRNTIIATSVHKINDTTSSGNSSATPYNSVSVSEVFYAATQGGAEALNLGDTIGNFAANKEFDALVIDTAVNNSPIDVFDGDTLEDVFSKFLLLGDDRNIVNVFVRGKRVV